MLTSTTNIFVGFIGMSDNPQIFYPKMQKNTEKLQWDFVQYIAEMDNSKRSRFHDIGDYLNLALNILGDSGEIIFLEEILFRPTPKKHGELEDILASRNVQIYRVVIGHGLIGSFDWLSDITKSTNGKEYFTFTSGFIPKNRKYINNVSSYFANINLIR